MAEKQIHIKNKKEMEELAIKISQNSKKGDIIGLKGTLGTGKTFFASHFINALLEEKTQIQSPTFNLVYSYPGKICDIYHFDLYRIKHKNELFEIGIENALINGITIIEWPEIAEDFCQKNYLEIEIKTIQNNEERIVTLNYF